MNIVFNYIKKLSILLLLICAVELSCIGATIPLQPPAGIAAKLNNLKWNFYGMAGVGGNFTHSSFQNELKKHSAAIEEIHQFTTATTVNEGAMADYLCSSLESFGERFKPGVEIEDRFLQEYCWHGKEADYGVNIEVYLLMEIAKNRESVAFNKRVLTALYNAKRASSYIMAKYADKWWPTYTYTLEKIDSGETTLGTEIALCCEKFMVDAYMADVAPVSQSGVPVINEYWQWRKKTMISDMCTKFLMSHYQNKTMEYVKRLIDVIPDK